MKYRRGDQRSFSFLTFYEGKKRFFKCIIPNNIVVDDPEWRIEH